MDYVVVTWMAMSALVAVSIALDMRQLRTNRVWLTLSAWLLVCAGSAGLAAVPYLLFRRAVRRDLVAAAMTLIGDESDCIAIRRQRLATLRHSGLLSDSVFLICKDQLDQFSRSRQRG